MKGKLFLFSICVAATFVAMPAFASVFSGSGSSSLKTRLGAGYEYIDATDYQNELNKSLSGLAEYQIETRGGSVDDLSLGALDARNSRWNSLQSNFSLTRGNTGTGLQAGSRRRGGNDFNRFDDRYRRRRHHRYHDYDKPPSDVHPAPEPATWLLLGAGLMSLGVFITVRRRREEIA